MKASKACGVSSAHQTYLGSRVQGLRIRDLCGFGDVVCLGSARDCGSGSSRRASIKGYLGLVKEPAACASFRG